MAAKPVIKYFKVFKNIQSGLGIGEVLPMKDQLGFESSKETFHRGIVVTVTLAAHVERTCTLYSRCG